MFSDQKVNSGRQVELDFAKNMSLFFMILLHCLMVSLGFKNTISIYMLRGVGQLLGEPFAATVFMFAMGVGFVYSRNQSPEYLVKRGIKQMLLGLVVNIGEFFIPHFLAGYLLGEWDIFPIAGGLLLFCVDILAFAGMAMIVMGVFKKLGLSTVQIVAIAYVLSVAGSFLRFSDFGSNVPNLVAGYFIGSKGGFTAFPLFNWFIFPATGLLFGEYYIRCTNKKKLLRGWLVAYVISITYFVVSWFIPGGFLSDTHHYYFMTTIDAQFCLICIYGIIGMSYFVTGFLPENIKTFFSNSSKNLNIIYIVQWFLIPLTYIFICYFNRDIVFNDSSVIVIAILEVAIATAIAAGYKKRIKKS